MITTRTQIVNRFWFFFHWKEIRDTEKILDNHGVRHISLDRTFFPEVSLGFLKVSKLSKRKTRLKSDCICLDFISLLGAVVISLCVPNYCNRSSLTILICFLFIGFCLIFMVALIIRVGRFSNRLYLVCFISEIFGF